MIESFQVHGGQIRHLAEHFGIPASQLLDFSANINPEGPPSAVLAALRASLDDLSMASAAGFAHHAEIRRVDETDEFGCFAVQQRIAALRIGARGVVPLGGIARQHVRTLLRLLVFARASLDP